MTNWLLKLISLYQKFIPRTYFSCRFQPSCSRYTYQAIQKYGILRGCLMGLKRLMRCNMFFPGGFDPLNE